MVPHNEVYENEVDEEGGDETQGLSYHVDRGPSIDTI
jgi:hypothetical protein